MSQCGRQDSLVGAFFLISILSLAQKQDRIWLFADSAGIDFNDLANPVAISSNIAIPCFQNFSSIANNQGQLLFYVAGVDLSETPMRIFDKNGNTMLNGDTLQGYAFVGQGCMIIPFSSDTNKYYVFICDREGVIGNAIYYSIVDMSLNGGLGAVISRNNVFLNDYISEKLNAVKHANGRDWWVITQSNRTNRLFHRFLITPEGILGPFDQFIGSNDNIHKFFGQMIFSKDGSKMVAVATSSKIDIFDFDRCTGDLFNYRSAGENIFSEQNGYYGCSISANGNVLYTSTFYPGYKTVYQYDLSATNIKSTKQTIISFPDTGQLHFHVMGQHLLGPDDRIYVMRGGAFTGPNSDTYYLHHMDVILEPDQLGSACNYQPFYFDLGRGRTIMGFPTMVNYNLGPVVGSICDSLTNGIKEPIDEKNIFQIYPNPFEDEITIHSIYPIHGKLIILDELGKVLFTEVFSENKTFNLSFLSAGVYFFSIETEKKVFKEKFVKLK